MKWLTVDTKKGTRCRVLEGGSGAPVVFFHGAGGLLTENPFLDGLAQHYQVFAPEWPGYGESTGDELLEDMLDFALHGWDLVDALGLRRPHVIGHSMGGMVGRYYVSLAGGDGIVRNLITIGSPHTGTEISRIGIGHPTRELVLGSPLLTRLAAAPPPARTRVTAVWSRGDALVPGARQLALPGAEVVMFPDLGHIALLASRRVARAVIDRLSGRVPASAAASGAEPAVVTGRRS